MLIIFEEKKFCRFEFLLVLLVLDKVGIFLVFLDSRSLFSIVFGLVICEKLNKVLLSFFFFLEKRNLERFRHYCVVTNFVIIKHKAMS